MAALERMCTSVEQAIELGTLDQHTAAQLAVELRLHLIDDPFRVAKALDTERFVSTRTLSDQLALGEGDDDDQLSESTTEWANDVLGVNLPIGGVTKGMLRSELDSVDVCFRKLSELARMKNRASATSKLDSLESAVRSGQCGTFAQMLVPNINAVLSKRDDAALAAQRTASLLEAEAQNPRANHRDAAWWWIRAAIRAEEASQPWIDDPAAGEAIDALLLESDAMSMATYPPLWESHVSAPLPWWAPGQDLLISGILARCERSAAAGDTAAAQRDLDRVIRMTAALSTNESIFSSLIAAGVLKRIAPLVQQHLPVLAPSHEAMRQLDQSIRRIPGRDPAGLLRAAAKTREHLEWATIRVLDPMILAPLPTHDGDLLNAMAWLRGWCSSQQPPIHIAPSSDWPVDSPRSVARTIHLVRVDGDTLEGWANLGRDSDNTFGFGDLGTIDLEASADAAHNSVAAIRSALRP